ncbi:TniQ family protein [Mycolicibacterium setense]
MSYPAPNLRTLPLRVAPLPGEAIDSWLEAIAARHKTTFGAVLAQCGIHAASIKAMRLIAPPGAIIDNVAHVAGVTPDIVSAMTLTPVYDGIPTRRRRRNGWQWRLNSRACPHCLAETAGRWQLWWRHNLSFACVKHQCLLIDACPTCRRPLRSRPHRLHAVPAPGYCACSTEQRPGIHPLCGADLTATVSVRLDSAHPVLRAQGRIDSLRADPQSLLADRANHSDVAGTLKDVTVLARWMVSAVDRTRLEHLLQSLTGTPIADLPRQYMDSSTAEPPCDPVNPDASTTAVSVALATEILDRPGSPNSRNLLQHIMTAAAPTRLTRPIAAAIRTRLTPEVGAAYQDAFDREYNERRVLYRLASAAAVEAAPPAGHPTKWTR